MSKVELDFFAYQWSVEEEDVSTMIRCYGVTKDNKNVYVRIDNFTPYCYVELPTNIEWTESRIELVSNKLANLNRKIYQPIRKEFVTRRKLYYAWKEKRKERKKKLDIDGKPIGGGTTGEKGTANMVYKDKLFPFLFLAFRSSAALRNFTYSMKNDIEIPGLGRIKFNLHEHEAGISPVLKLQALKKLPSAGMIKVKGIRIPDADKESTCDYEISCSYDNLFPIDTSEIIEPKVLSFDIEANSTITSAMPDASRPNDKVFQIGFATLVNKVRKKLLFSLGNPDPKKVGLDVELRTFKTEADLLVSLCDYIHEGKFNIIIGYNILGWDFQYMISRAKYTKCFSEFDMMGMLMGKHSVEVAPKFESKAYTAQKLVYLDAEGRLFLDLLPIVKRGGEKLVNYRLGTVLEYFNLPSKDPLTARDIFRCYREFTPDSLGICGKYCVQDAYATLLLYEKMQTWYGMCEMAKTAHVPIFYLFSKGTQIQMFSQVMEYCMYNNYVIISNGYVMKDGDEYMGAIVLTPVPGKYKKVISFDFASLYPSIMMAHNIDYATLINEGEHYLVDRHDVEEYLMAWRQFPCFIKMSSIDMFDSSKNIEEWDTVRNRSELQTKVENMKDKYPGKLVAIFKDKSEIPDEHCHVFCWADHSNCCHDMNRKRLKNGSFSKSKVMKVICGQRYYRFIKAEYGGKGVVPTLLESLISRRKATRNDIKTNSKEIKDKLISLIKNGGDEEYVKDFLKEFEMREKDLFCDIDGDVEKADKEIINPKEFIERIEFLETTNHILDKRQASYKVCANSMYGAMGVKKGYLPLLPGASSVTYKGRCSIEFISTHIPEKYNGVTVYGDSVTGDTPVIVRYSNGTIDVRMIEDLGNEWIPSYKTVGDDVIEKEHSSCGNLEVWVDGKWSKIRRVIRHNTDKKIYRVLTHTGCIDVTEDHSLLTDEGCEIKPEDLNEGSTKLLHSFPSGFEEFVFLSKKQWNITDNVVTLKCLQCLEFKELDKFYNRTINKKRYQKDNKCIVCCRRNYDDKRIIGFTHVEEKRKVEDVDIDEAFVWGLFMAEGSCGTYYCDSGNKHTWAINNQDYKLLEKCRDILKEREGYDFKILDTMKSSAVYKLVPVGCTKYMVLKYREMFYHGKERTGDNIDGEKSYKIVPYIILNCIKNIQKSFFEGWYEGDGEKKGYKLGKNFRFDCKGKIGSQGLFYIAKSLGYKYISVNNLVSDKKGDVFRITGSNEKYRKDPDTVKKIHVFENKYNKMVYDLETEEGAFHAGVGCLVVKNTDSSHIYFPHIKDNKDAVELAERIVDEIQIYFPKPMKLEFEKIYEKYIILTKKRYMARVANKKGEIIEFIKKGVMLSRRDNCITGDSLVSLSNGTSVRIDTMTEFSDVFSWDGTGIVPSKQTAFKYQGEKECVKVTLADGRSIKCTPDHKLLVKNKNENTEWKSAGKLTSFDRVICEGDKNPLYITLPVIDNVRIGVHKVYDISVDKTKSFVANGIVVHNCTFARKIYLKTSESLLDDVDENIILNDIIDGINSLFERKYSFKDFVITKSMARAVYKMKTVPAHVQLAYKMRSRGIEVPVGARIEYLFTTRCIGEKKFAQGDKVEDVDYFSQWRRYLRVDYLYYLEKQLIKPLDELLDVGLGIKNFVKNQYDLRMNKWIMMERIKELSMPQITIEGDEEVVVPKKTAVAVKKTAPKKTVTGVKKTPKKRARKIAEVIFDSDDEYDDYDVKEPKVKIIIEDSDDEKEDVREKWSWFSDDEKANKPPVESIYGVQK